MKEHPMANGHTLFVEVNEVGCRRYWSDEVGGGVMVWDTALVDHSTLLEALVMESGERIRDSKKRRQEPSR